MFICFALRCPLRAPCSPYRPYKKANSSHLTQELTRRQVWPIPGCSSLIGALSSEPRLRVQARDGEAARVDLAAGLVLTPSSDTTLATDAGTSTAAAAAGVVGADADTANTDAVVGKCVAVTHSDREHQVKGVQLTAADISKQLDEMRQQLQRACDTAVALLQDPENRKYRSVPSMSPNCPSCHQTAFHANKVPTTLAIMMACTRLAAVCLCIVRSPDLHREQECWFTSVTWKIRRRCNGKRSVCCTPINLACI